MRNRRQKTTNDSQIQLNMCEITSKTEPIHLDFTDILQAIDAANELESLEDVRQAVADIALQVDGLLQDSGLSADRDAEYVKNELTQAARSRTIERAKHYLLRLTKALTEVKTNSINDINLNRWKDYDDILTDSLWILDRRDSSGAHTAEYWGNFIPQIPNQLIRRFTKPGDWVLDVFAGSGTTLIESQRLGRNCVGVELNPAIAERARELIACEPNRYGTCCEVVVGDNRDIDIAGQLRGRGAQNVQLVIMHPPYHDIIKFSEDPRDMSNAKDTDGFLGMIGQSVDNFRELLQPGRHLGLVIGDKFSKGEWIPLGFLTSQVIMQKGFMLKSIIVKNFEDTMGKRSQKELWRYRSLVGGYYVFKHEYIFLFTRR